MPTPLQFPRNKVSYEPTSDSPTFSLCHLAVANSAGAALSPWEGLIQPPRLSPSREEIHELLPRHRQSSVRCLTIPVQFGDYPAREPLYPRDFFSLPKAMEACLTRQLNCRPMQERPSNDSNLQISKSVWVVSSQPSLTMNMNNRKVS